MSKILFSHSYFYRFDPKQWKAKQPYPPLGTLYAAAYLRSQGYAVSLFDTNLKETPDEIVPVLRKEKPKYLVIYDDGFNYLTKMCLTNMREAAFRLAELGKEAGCIVIVSSSDSTDHSGMYLANGADYVILGEAEITLGELIDNLEEQNRDLQNLQGLVYFSLDKTINTGRREIIKDLDFLPMPAWDLVDINSYKNIWLENHAYFSLNIATTRGCPFKCNWCAKPIYGNRYNTRSPENVVEEIRQLINNYSVDHFWICDDIFGLKPGWVKRFRNLVKENNLKFTYQIQSRVDLLLKEDTIDDLAESGAASVWLGAESGSQKILDAMDKGTTVRQIHSATKLLKSKGVKTAFFLQFGYPGEQKEDIQKTIDMVLELLPDDIGISVSYPLPGTVFYEKVKEELKTKANWTDSDDLAVMFRSTYSPQFYKKLHRYLHKVYRKKQGIHTMKNLLMNPTSVNKRKLRSALLTFYYIPTSIIDSIKLKKLENTA
jgi:anaerobic magnesium-protoporphyrin IX monomethyl ester cyclase